MLLAGAVWWQSFPWAAVGAAVGVITLIIGALKLAVMTGANQQRTLEHERRITALELKAEGVPDTVEAEVSVQTAAAESAEKLLRQNVARLSRRHGNLDRRLVAIEARCAQINGPPSQVISVDDNDELLLEPPKETDDAA